MLTKGVLSLVTLLASVSHSLAVVPLYGQCGGQGYNGDTVCTSGSTCVKLNDFYSQCLPGGSPTTSVTTTTTTTTTSTTATTTTTTTTSVVIPTPTQTGPFTVLPLGDSITFGIGSNDGNSYRKELKDSLARDGITIDYIGTQRNGNMQDNENQGHSGATIDQISNFANTALAQRPQVVTMMAGTNDISQNIDLANGPNRVIRLVDKIFTSSPNATVLLATLIPISYAQANVDSFNSRLEPLVQSKINAGQHIVLVSMSSVLRTDLPDGVHPNAAGFVKMGQNFYRGWKTAQEKGWIR